MTSPQGAFGDYQLEIYGAGLRGVLPRFPMAFAELEARAERALAPSVLSSKAAKATGGERTSGIVVMWQRAHSFVQRAATMTLHVACGTSSAGVIYPPAPCSRCPVQDLEQPKSGSMSFGKDFGPET